LIANNNIVRVIMWFIVLGWGFASCVVGIIFLCQQRVFSLFKGVLWSITI
jgi:hypothetical protein